ncbi:nucleotidyltransferase family protein [Micromonospora sp. WMMD712]|uniref:nucleotidyltransferase family protein n=1 Tax=Micromonospora sp. WMMD712 TaxID=3016096 RepID=UPI00249C0270|nr:nucleotidyltransferase family protein [Micromonospora sp. WMMD712]WFE60199.1 nucleotidyltransferase family protein [Micromonospora sp. WMMD712]
MTRRGTSGPSSPPAAGVLLAAGAGSRYGGPKALARHPDGGFFVERAARTLVDGGCSPTVVVLGAAAQQVRDVADLDGTMPVDKPDWSDGMGSSLRTALAVLASTGAPAALVLLVDQPGVTAEAVRRVARDATAASLVMAAYPGGRRGHPVLLGRSHWAGVAALAVGDAGARAYLRAHAERLRVVDCSGIADDTDVDRPGWSAGA